MNNLTESMVGMDNNLTQCIEKSGMSNNEVAAAKGVTPETLRRHKNCKIQMTIKDAEHYARIIGVSVQKILFKSTPIPVVGINIVEEKHVARQLHDTPQYEVYADNSYTKDRACWLWKTTKKYSGIWYEWDGAISFIRYSPIVDKIISEDCYQKICVVKTKETINDNGIDQNIFGGVLYPQPGGLFTVHNGKTNSTVKDVELEWATPTLSTVFRPDLLGVHITEIKK